MSSVNFSVDIQAGDDAVWQALLDEMEHPERYNDTILQSNVLERFAGGILRQVDVPDATVRERIEFDVAQKVVTSALISHPHINGEIKKFISPVPALQPTLKLTAQLSWDTNDTKVEEMIRRNVAEFVMQSLRNIKSRVEANP